MRKRFDGTELLFLFLLYTNPPFLTAFSISSFRGRVMCQATSNGCAYATRPPLSSLVSTIALGGGCFTLQSDPDPESLPVRGIVSYALDHGIRTFDTSPYYGPSEALLGDAFAQPNITKSFSRQDYILMTKVGRIAAAEFDYSPSWIRQSVNRSLERLQTSYLDVVFCHDIEYVTDEDALGAIEVLLQLRDEGVIRYVGISGYPVDKLIRVANVARVRFGQPLDAVQCWAQLTLQNTNLEAGIRRLRAAGVDCVFNSSPLGVGMLRSHGVPIGGLGDWHPAPEGLRHVIRQASDLVETKGVDLATLALRYSVSRIMILPDRTPGASTIFAARSVEELEENMAAIKTILREEDETEEEVIEKFGDIRDMKCVNMTQLEKDLPIFREVQSTLAHWIGYTFTSPEKEWDVELKRMIAVTAADATGKL
ncbi:Aldo/keto reductase family-domain-containing protein [Leptodontidium sp. MPI-SDFR-AT-0119]|nr:Aldo/keto reductase family-domain-containing protein [Leptodontidium sp. MPI-SDFR-AT-0119]